MGWENHILSRRIISRTRKDHTCMNCDKRLPAGVSAQRTVFFDYDGVFQCGYEHLISCDENK